MKCPTCYEPLISDSKNYIVTTPCGHLFHTNCVQSWIATGNQTCPQCRSSISKEKLLRIYLPSNGSDDQLSQETDEYQQTSENTFHQHLSSDAVAYSSQGNSVSLNYPSNSVRTENELSNQLTTRTTAVQSNGSDVQLPQVTNEDWQPSENDQHLPSNAVPYSSQGNSISLNYPLHSVRTENEISNQGTTRTNNTRTTAVQSNVTTVPINTRASNQKVNDNLCSGQPCGVYVLYACSFTALVCFVLILVHFGISRSKEKVSFKNQNF